MTTPATGLQLLSLVKDSGEIEITLANAPVPAPKTHEVIVQVQAEPAGRDCKPRHRPTGVACPSRKSVTQSEAQGQIKHVMEHVIEVNPIQA